MPQIKNSAMLIGSLFILLMLLKNMFQSIVNQKKDEIAAEEKQQKMVDSQQRSEQIQNATIQRNCTMQRTCGGF